MVGAVCVVGFQLVESKTSCSFLCLDGISPSSSSGGCFIMQRHYSAGTRHVRRITKVDFRPYSMGGRLGSLELSTSFLHHSPMKARLGSKNLRKQRKKRSLVIVDELAGHYEDNFEDVKKQMLDFFTYKAVRTVLNQLNEMNSSQYQWFKNYVETNEHGYGKKFIRNLGKEDHDLAQKVMATRLHLYGKWVKKCDHIEMYGRISDQNLELLRERLMETVIWPLPSDDSNTEFV